MSEKIQKLSQTESYEKLKKLAPADLTKILHEERVNSYQIEKEGALFLYGFERVEKSHLDLLEKLAVEQSIFAKLQKAVRGEVVNTIIGFSSENRMVLHTAMRDLFPKKPLPLCDPLLPGAIKAASDAAKEFAKLAKFCKDNPWIQDVIVVGIGGSYLGPQAVFEGLSFFHIPGRRLFFCSNIDPDEAAAIVGKVCLEKTVVCVISKSGTTLETLTNECFLQEEFRKKGVDPKGHFIAVTGEKSPMDDPQKYLASFYMWDFVGGRYSVTSMVGAVPLALLIGPDQTMEFLRGAHDMDCHALCSSDPKENIPMMMALLAIYRRILGMDTLAVLPYAQVLNRFVDHLQQLHMESLGKSVSQSGEKMDTITGIVHFGVPGTNGQHSFYQQLHQGVVKSGLEFIGFKESQGGLDHKIQGTTNHQKLLANLFAQMRAFAEGAKNDNPNENFEGNRGSVTLFFPKCTPYTMGQLLSIYEIKTMFEGFLLGVNSYDQPGVQLGKRLANECLEIMKGKTEKEGGLFSYLIAKLDRL